MSNLDLFNEFWLRAEKKRIFPEYVKHIKSAEPFALEDEFAELAGQLAFGKQATDHKISQYLGVARLPFPEMWIEADFESAFGLISKDTQFVLGHPTRIGWLLRELGSQRGFVATRVARVWNPGLGEEVASIYPIIHCVTYDEVLGDPEHAQMIREYLKRDYTPKSARILADMNSHAAYRMLAWSPDGPENFLGISLEGIDKVQRDSSLFGRNIFAMEHTFQDEYDGKYDAQSGSDLEQTLLQGLYDQTGELAFIVTALAILNHVPVKFVPYRPQGRTIIAGGTRPFMASNVVQISVPASRRRIKETDKRLRSAFTEAQRKRHRVRGHLRYSKERPRANIDRWTWMCHPVTQRWGWHTRIDPHERGSAALGWVNHTYNVTAKSGAAEAFGLTPQRVDRVGETV